MDSKKYQIFISSTYSDLTEERDGIIKSILEMYHIPIGMEMFSAEDEDQWEIIRRTIAVSDYYILILGLRYGSKMPDDISFTQKEYEYALTQKIPILAFLLHNSAPLSQEKRDDNLTEINNFRNLVLKNSKMSQFWSTKDELLKNVSIALMKQIMQKPGVGWIRGDTITTSEALSTEITALSKENRELRDEIADLRERALSVDSGSLPLGVGYDGILKILIQDNLLSFFLGNVNNLNARHGILLSDKDIEASKLLHMGLISRREDVKSKVSISKDGIAFINWLKLNHRSIYDEIR